MHDWSKFSPTEFWRSAKYFAGDKSPTIVERQYNDGISQITLHHTLRNKHHWHCYVDFMPNGLVIAPFDFKHNLEYVCDIMSASKVYMGKKYKTKMAYDYFYDHSKWYLMNPGNKEFILWCVNEIDKYGFKKMKKKYTRENYNRIMAKYPKAVFIPFDNFSFDPVTIKKEVKTVKNIILKSSSPRRRELLTNMGYSFEVKVYDVEETLDNTKTPYENVKDLGLLKCSVNKELDYGSILIGCDTIVVFDGEIYGKPKDKEDAYRMLRSLSGKTHEVMSGLSVIYKEHVYSDVCVSKVFFKELSDEDINSYIEGGECFGKAGAYAIQGEGRRLVDHYEGSLNNIIGLPTELLEKILGEINEMED